MEKIEEYAGRLQLGAELSDDDSEEQQAIYRLLQMEATLSHDGDQHWVDLVCFLGETHLSTIYTNVGCNGFALR